MQKRIYTRVCQLLLVVLCFSNIKIVYSQGSTKTVNLSSTELQNNDDDLQQLDAYFKDVKIVGMGESTHGTHEFFTLRHRMFKYLVKNHHFNTFFLEADYANCLRTNAYIHGIEDDVKAVVREMNMWPWRTAEMVDLVNWIREYNLKNKTNQINFIGVDMQRYLETVKQMDNILRKNKLSTTDSIIYQKIFNTNFLSVTDIEGLEIYKTVYEEKKTIDVSQLNKEDSRIYQILIRHLGQIINGKEYNFRDKKMAENIFFHLNSDSTIKGFFWAHNGHVANFYKKRRKEGRSKGSAGGNLKHLISDKYFSIGQEFDEGSFNAYYPDSTSTNIIKGKGFTLGPVMVGPSIEKSFSATYRTLEKPVFIECATLPKKERVLMTFIGAVYYPDRDGNPKSIARNNSHGRNGFDAIILIDKSTPTQLLKK